MTVKMLKSNYKTDGYIRLMRDGKEYCLPTYYNVLTRRMHVLTCTTEKKLLYFEGFAQMQVFFAKCGKEPAEGSGEAMVVYSLDLPCITLTDEGKRIISDPNRLIKTWDSYCLLARSCGMFFEGNLKKYAAVYNRIKEYCFQYYVKRNQHLTEKEAAYFEKNLNKVFKRRNRILKRLVLCPESPAELGWHNEPWQPLYLDDDLDFVSRLKQKGYEFERVRFEQDIDPEEEEIRFQGIVEDVKAGRKKISELSAVDAIKLHIYCRKKLEEMRTFESDDEEYDEDDEEYDESDEEYDEDDVDCDEDDEDCDEDDVDYDEDDEDCDGD